MGDIDIVELTVQGAQDAFASGAATSEALTQAFLDRIAAWNPAYNAIIFLAGMQAIPKELYEAAAIDGASRRRQFWQITLPLCRPPMAALAVLEVTWIYNEFFWATVLLQSGEKFPVTSSLNNLKGQFFVDYNLLSAGAMLVALPPIIVFFLLQKQFVAGLTAGAVKG